MKRYEKVIYLVLIALTITLFILSSTSILDDDEIAPERRIVVLTDRTDDSKNLFLSGVTGFETPLRMASNTMRAETPEEQLEQIDLCIKQKAAGIIIMPFNKNEIIGHLDEYQLNIPLVFVDTDLSPDGYVDVGYDRYEAVEELMHYTVNQRIVLLNTACDPDGKLQERLQAAHPDLPVRTVDTPEDLPALIDSRPKGGDYIVGDPDLALALDRLLAERPGESSGIYAVGSSDILLKRLPQSESSLQGAMIQSDYNIGLYAMRALNDRIDGRPVKDVAVKSFYVDKYTINDRKIQLRIYPME